LLDYRRAHGFKTYIVSGGGVGFLRALAQEACGLPPERGIGSSVKTNDKLRDGEPVIVRLPELEFIDHKEGKPVAMNQFIGRRPIAASGSTILVHQDILFLFVGPVGWFCFIVVGARSLGITALEQAPLAGIICAEKADKHLGVLGALLFASANAWPVIRVTTRMIALTLLAMAPFLALSAVVCFTLLTEIRHQLLPHRKTACFRAGDRSGRRHRRVLRRCA
jgi:hypothetical protein